MGLGRHQSELNRSLTLSCPHKQTNIHCIRRVRAFEPINYSPSICIDVLCVLGFPQNDQPSKPWRAESGFKANGMEILLMAILLVARAHKQQLDEWVEIVLLQEHSYTQVCGSSATHVHAFIARALLRCAACLRAIVARRRRRMGSTVEDRSGVESERACAVSTYTLHVSGGRCAACCSTRVA
eukprot:6181211-Pleurochrysis_carterae.AAC.1